MSTTTLVRIPLGFMAVITAQIGFWAVLAPRSFYDDFPGLGRTWVSVDGPFNEHLVRDVGALNLALLALLLFAAWRPTRELLTATGVAAAAWGVPHLAYHLFNTADQPVGDLVASLGGLLAFVVFAGVLLNVARTFVPAPQND